MRVTDLKAQITELAHIMEEFGLEDAKLKNENFLVEFRRNVETTSAPQVVEVASPSNGAKAAERSPRPEKSRKSASNEQVGTPIPCPMTGIYYTAPSPNDPPFVKPGDVIAPGQIIGLIEAMKVFNDVTSSIGGQVTKVAAESGQLVQQGEALIYVK